MKKRIVIIFAILLVIIALYFLFFENSKEKGIVHFNYENKQYDILVSDKYLDIVEYDVIYCIKAPCDPIKGDSFRVKNNKTYKKILYDLLEDNTEITINYNEDDSYNYEKLLEIVKEDNKN